jgi:hypothetical protein
MFSLVHWSECDEFRHDLGWIVNLGGEFELQGFNKDEVELKLLEIKEIP